MKRYENYYIAGSLDEALKNKERLERMGYTIDKIDIGQHSIGSWIKLYYSKMIEEED